MDFVTLYTIEGIISYSCKYSIPSGWGKRKRSLTQEMTVQVMFHLPEPYEPCFLGKTRGFSSATAVVHHGYSRVS
jgi:hypothetical protein